MPSLFPIDFSRKEEQGHRDINKPENSVKQTNKPIKKLRKWRKQLMGKG